ncbi:MAG: hypothetical protein EOR67_04765 [Mesorhizobium sp.]|uniref:hypothetical protein n=2 Tax=Mesorhizobium sp. TaxID=1871066 RepID=UPI000FE89E20|nr:hypothetical protein [Mesorhizobium sp.]RWL83550.1 MAG: hypothetical protein EOR69_12425 [Mesorhizobium sp.]RWL90701.1 MAG: hypothetical protein EOR67_04765 [Mesorhizobium sp.]RWM00291.1 MAG: hypothetical protein EOR70_10000 [Mesorhizobium sp.]
MDRNKTDAVFVLVAALAAFAIYNLACGLKTGEIRGRLNWISCADDPTRFWSNVIGNLVAVIALLGFLWLLHRRGGK